MDTSKLRDWMLKLVNALALVIFVVATLALILAILNELGIFRFWMR